MIWMPGKSYKGALAPLTEKEKKLVKSLRADVTKLAADIGERNLQNYPKALEQALVYLEGQFKQMGYSSKRQAFQVGKQRVYNLEVEKAGHSKKDEIVVLGAHYDSVIGTPGANDNGSGVASLLALARFFKKKKNSSTLRFVAFVNEEPPYFQQDTMGSLVYAKKCKAQGDKITAVISLETMGCFSDQKASQRYPLSALGWVYPTQGNFIAFVGNFSSRKLVRKVVGSFRKKVKFPSQGTALPGFVPGVGWSDHWSFWQVGYPGLMVTDTAPFRYSHYHKSTDTPDKIDFERLARVVAGLEKVLDEVVGIEKE